MNDHKVFCEECRKEVLYTVEEQQLEGALKNEIYSYIGKIAYCAECGAELYVSDLTDYNLAALYNAYRVKKGIIPLEMIRAIPEKYAIGKRPLSLLLGWGEQTFSRYCEGDMPTKQYSEMLKRIYNDPVSYAKLLEENKTNLKSTTTYNKSKKIVDELVGKPKKQNAKIDLAIGYLLSQCEDVTPLALQKALYYIQGFYFAFFGVFIFKEDCEAWVHGPVYRDIYFRYRDYHFDTIENPEEFDASVFSSSEKAILDSIVKNICCYSGKVLEKFTHAENPWLQTRGKLPDEMGSDKIIDKNLIGKYFATVKEKYNMLSSADIKDYTQRMFEQI